jgi:hypothetical protein
MRLRYDCTDFTEQVHRPDGWPYQPHLHGFMAHTSMKTDGYVTAPDTLEIVT